MPDSKQLECHVLSIPHRSVCLCECVSVCVCVCVCRGGEVVRDDSRVL